MLALEQEKQNVTQRKKWKDLAEDRGAWNREKQQSVVLSSGRQLIWFSTDGGVGVRDLCDTGLIIILKACAKHQGCPLSISRCFKVGHLSFPVFPFFTSDVSLALDCGPWPCCPQASILIPHLCFVTGTQGVGPGTGRQAKAGSNLETRLALWMVLVLCNLVKRGFVL